MLENVVGGVFPHQTEHAPATDDLIFLCLVTGEVSGGVLEDGADQALIDLCDLLGAALVRENLDLGFVKQLVADNLRDELHQVVEGQNRLACITSGVLDEAVPLIACNKLGVLTARLDVVHVERNCGVVVLPHLIEKFVVTLIPFRDGNLRRWQFHPILRCNIGCHSSPLRSRFPKSDTTLGVETQIISSTHMRIETLKRCR